MATKTERRNMERSQDALGVLKAAAIEEMAGNKSQGNARIMNAWTKVLGKVTILHAEMTEIGLDNFPEFFADEIVIKGGGGGR